MQWLFAKGQFDPDREATEKTFMKRVVRNRLLNILQEIRARKREIRLNSISLEKEMEINEGKEIEKFIGVDGDVVKVNARADLGVGLSQAFIQMSARQKRLCRLLGEEGLSISEASRRLKIPRTTLHSEILRIREIFRKEGLADHLG